MGHNLRHNVPVHVTANILSFGAVWMLLAMSITFAARVSFALGVVWIIAGVIGLLSLIACGRLIMTACTTSAHYRHCGGDNSRTHPDFVWMCIFQFAAYIPSVILNLVWYGPSLRESFMRPGNVGKALAIGAVTAYIVGCVMYCVVGIAIHAAYYCRSEYTRSAARLGGLAQVEGEPEEHAHQEDEKAAYSRPDGVMPNDAVATPIVGMAIGALAPIRAPPNAVLFPAEKGVEKGADTQRATVTPRSRIDFDTDASVATTALVPAAASVGAAASVDTTAPNVSIVVFTTLNSTTINSPPGGPAPSESTTQRTTQGESVDDAESDPA
jgi:hypothetical protein